jgi:hypothetical protein
MLPLRFTWVPIPIDCARLTSPRIIPQSPMHTPTSLSLGTPPQPELPALHTGPYHHLDRIESQPQS